MQVLASVSVLAVLPGTFSPQISEWLAFPYFIQVLAQQSLNKEVLSSLITILFKIITYNAMLTYTFPTHLIFLSSTYTVGLLPPTPAPGRM